MDWQFIIVGLCVAAATAVTARRIVRWLRPVSACGGCANCAVSTASPPVVTLEALKSQNAASPRPGG